MRLRQRIVAETQVDQRRRSVRREAACAWHNPASKTRSRWLAALT